MYTSFNCYIRRTQAQHIVFTLSPYPYALIFHPRTVHLSSSPTRAIFRPTLTQPHQFPALVDGFFQLVQENTPSKQFFSTHRLRRIRFMKNAFSRLQVFLCIYHTNCRNIHAVCRKIIYARKIFVFCIMQFSRCIFIQNSFKN